MTFIQKHLLIVLFLMISSTPSFAAFSDWKDLGGGKARVIAVKDPETDKLSGIVEVVLTDGWKTYWLSPGSSGIPPEFDFSKSTNLVFEPVQFPTPKRIAIPDTEFYGYKGSVGFVFEALATDNDASIKLEMLIGICEEICIPATAEFSIPAGPLNSNDPKSSIAISIAKSRLPVAANDDFYLSALKVETGQIKGIVTARDMTGNVDVVLQASNVWTSDPISMNMAKDGTGDFSLPLPKKLHEMTLKEIQWQYTLLHRSGTDSHVENSVTGGITISSPK